jgi:hypothetical protein
MLSRCIGFFFFWKRNVSDNTCRENKNTHFVFIKLFPESRAVVWENVEKYGKAGQATDDNMARALCMPDN